LNATPKKIKLITISGISDREGNAASPPTINAIANRIGALITEMGLSARIEIEEKRLRGRIQKRHHNRSDHGSRGRRRKIKTSTAVKMPLRASLAEGEVVAPNTSVPGDR